MNEGFVVHALRPDVRVAVTRAMPALVPALDARVEALWQAAAARVAAGGAGRLFNGRVFSADRIGTEEITGHVTEFRRIVAQMEDPALFSALGLRPLAVCGVLCCADGVPVGRRHPAAIYQPGMWQLPPAGSVDPTAMDADGRVDLRKQVLAELREEVGVEVAQVGAVRPLCAVEHPGSHVTDVGIVIMTALTGAEVLALHQGRGNREYERLRFLTFAEIPAFLVEAGDALVPPAREFLRRAGLVI